MVKTIIETGIPKVKQYLSERNEALQLSDIAEHLGVTDSAAFGVLDLMYAFGIVQKANRIITYDEDFDKTPPRKSLQRTTSPLRWLAFTG